MAQTKRDKIVANIVSAIKTVKKVNGYYNDIPDAYVERARTKPMDPKKMPAVVVYEDTEVTVDREYGTNPKIHTDLVVEVHLWAVLEGESLSTELNELEGDITKAVMADVKRNNYALYTEKDGSEPFYVPGAKAMGGRVVTFTVRYIQQENDPFE